MTLRTPGQRLGWLGYIEILVFLQRAPATTFDIERQCGIADGSGWALMRKLRVVKLVHISGWAPHPARRRKLVPLWSPFEGADAPRPSGAERELPSRSKNLSANLIALASIIRALRQPISAEDLATETGCTAHYLRIQLRAMRDVGFVRIADWKPFLGSGPPTALWALGKGADARRPPPIPTSVINTRNWNRRRARLKHMELVNAMAGPMSKEVEHA